jgi:hypothetical protein
MKDKDWEKEKVRKLKQEKKEALNKYNSDEGTSMDVKNRKKLKEEFKKERRSIKRASKQYAQKQIDEEVNKFYDNK